MFGFSPRSRCFLPHRFPSHPSCLGSSLCSPKSVSSPLLYPRLLRKLIFPLFFFRRPPSRGVLHAPDFDARLRFQRCSFRSSSEQLPKRRIKVSPHHLSSVLSSSPARADSSRRVSFFPFLLFSDAQLGPALWMGLGGFVATLMMCCVGPPREDGSFYRYRRGGGERGRY